MPVRSNKPAAVATSMLISLAASSQLVTSSSWPGLACGFSGLLAAVASHRDDTFPLLI